MDPALISNLLLCAVNLLLAGLVFCVQPRKLANQTFVGVLLTVVGWSFSVKMYSMDLVSTAQPPEVLWGRFVFACASLLGSSFVVFCRVFPDRQSVSLGKWPLCLVLLGTVMAGLSLTPLVVHSVELSGTGLVQRHYGPLYPVFGVL